MILRNTDYFAQPYSLKQSEGGVLAPGVHSSVSWGMFFLSVFAFFAVGRVTDPFPFLHPLRLAMVTGALAVIPWILAPGSFEDKIPIKIPQVRHVVLLMILAIVSIPISIWPGGSFKAVTGDLWKLVLFFLLVCYWCRSMRDARRLIWMCCIGVSSLVLFSLLTGHGGAAAARFGGRFAAGSGTYDPNDLALVLAMHIPLLVFLLGTSGPVARLLAGVMAIICLYGIVLTQSRGGFLALVAVSVLLMWRTRLSPALKFLIVLAVFLVFATMAGSEFWDRMATIWSPKSEHDRTAGGRTELWITGLKIIATHPWGSGYGLCAIAEGVASGGKAFRWNTAHNSFLQVGIELGVAGLIVFVCLLLRTYKDLRRVQALQFSSPQHRQEKDLASMLEVSLIGFLVGGFFLSQAYSMFLYFVVGLSFALSRMAISEQTSSSTIRQTQYRLT
jgi:probable O-glycosylation ligase (exosortase A-associated)